jgi:hypothetical protein
MSLVITMVYLDEIKMNTMNTHAIPDNLLERTCHLSEVVRTGTPRCFGQTLEVI